MIDDDDEFLVCPRCKNPVSALPDLNSAGEVYFCYRCMLEVEPIADDDGSENFRPEFELAPGARAWWVLVGVALGIALLVSLWPSQ